MVLWHQDLTVVDVLVMVCRRVVYDFYQVRCRLVTLVVLAVVLCRTVVNHHPQSVAIVVVR